MDKWLADNGFQDRHLADAVEIMGVEEPTDLFYVEPKWMKLLARNAKLTPVQFSRLETQLYTLQSTVVEELAREQEPGSPLSSLPSTSMLKDLAHTSFGSLPVVSLGKSSYTGWIPQRPKDFSKDKGAQVVKTQLFDSVRTGDIERLDRFLNENKDLIDINWQNNEGMTLVFSAVAQKKEACLQRLLCEPGVDVNMGDSSLRTPLWVACCLGELRMAEMLLRCEGVDVNRACDSGCTPLGGAVSLNHILCVKALLAVPGVDVNQQDTGGLSPLIIAAGRGYDQSIEALVRSDGVDINLRDKEGRCALVAAAGRGRTKCVEKLLVLGKDSINVNSQDNDGVTALIISVDQRHLECVRLLLNHPAIDVGLCNTGGKSAVFVASQRGYPECLIALLQSGHKVDINCQDNFGRTPLWTAVDQYNTDCIGILRDTDGIDLNLCDQYQRTALNVAMSLGHSIPLKLLLDMPLLDVNKVDKVGRSPLWMAAHEGHHKCIDLLLKKRKDADINACCSQGNSPLIVATVQNKPECVRLLLQYEKIDVNWQESGGRSALLFAASLKNPEILKILLKEPSIDVNRQCQYGRTAIVYAMSDDDNKEESSNTTTKVAEGNTSLTHRIECLKHLLKAKDIDLNIRSDQKRTALSCAAVKPHTIYLDMLLDHGSANVNAQEMNNWAALHLAVFYERTDAVAKLIAAGARLDLQTDDKMTALHIATRKGTVSCLRVLLESEDIGNCDVNAIDKFGKTALHYAAREGRDECVELLLKSPHIDPNLEDSESSSPLEFSALANHIQCVRHLLKHPRIKYSLETLLTAVTHKYPKLEIYSMLLANLDMELLEKSGAFSLEYAFSAMIKGKFGRYTTAEYPAVSKRAYQAYQNFVAGKPAWCKQCFTIPVPPAKLLVCAGHCGGKVGYCCKEHQKADWPAHKKNCHQ